MSKVEFYAGATKLGDATSTPYELVWSPSLVGSYDLTAIATDNAGATATSNATRVNVTAPPPPPNVAPLINLTSPAVGASVVLGDVFTVAANASDSDGVVGKVEFFAGAMSLGVITTPPYALEWTPAQLGSQSLTAVATDDVGATTVSSAVAVDVVAPPPPPPPNVPPSVVLTSPSAGASVVLGASFTLTASASDSDGTVSKVEFYAGTTKLSQSTSAPYTFDWTPAQVGDYTLTAIGPTTSALRRHRAP